jgi:hypothetical protein
MILGRPTNLWNGLVVAIIAFTQVTAITLGAPPVPTATILGALGGLLGVVILIVANQPPSIAEGSSYTVVTSAGEPNVEKVANAYPTPPANLIPKT